MRIGIVTAWFPRGAAYVSRQYAQTLAAAHEVRIYARGGQRPPASETEWHGPEVHWARAPVFDAGPDSIDLPDFDAWLVRERLDWVIFTDQFWMEPVLTCAQRGVHAASCVIEYHTEQIPLYDAYDLLICNSRQHYELFSARHPGARYIPWGTDLATFYPASLEAVEPGWVTFVHAAGLNAHRKGTDLVMQAFAQLVDEGARRIKLQLRSQGAIRARLGERELARLEALGVLVYRGPDAPDPTARAPEPDRRSLYARGDVYLYPCRFDGLGLSVPEAMACGLVPISTDYPPMNEFVFPGSGRTVAITHTHQEPRAHHRFAEPSLASLVEQMRACAADFDSSWKRRARADAEAHLDWVQNARDLPALFGDRSYQDPAVRERALADVRAFEASRRTSLRARVGHRWPELVRGGRAVARWLRGRI